MTAPGREFSPPRVERYLVAIRSSGAQAVVVLNKSDLAHDLAGLVADLYEVAGKPRARGTALREADGERVVALREALDLAKKGAARVRRGSPEDRAFLADLRNHASGFLAPLIKDLVPLAKLDDLVGRGRPITTIRENS